jgi:CheY-like chemotaxis protein
MAKTVLIVEDNPHTQKRLQTLLVPLGAVVHVAGNGPDALAMVAQHRPDLIVMDIMLPGMSGLEVIRRLKADAATSSIPVIALTTLAMAGDMEQIKTAGADGFVAKPINPDMLISALKPHLV